MTWNYCIFRNRPNQAHSGLMNSHQDTNAYSSLGENSWGLNASNSTLETTNKKTSVYLFVICVCLYFYLTAVTIFTKHKIVLNYLIYLLLSGYTILNPIICAQFFDKTAEAINAGGLLCSCTTYAVQCYAMRGDTKNLCVCVILVVVALLQFLRSSGNKPVCVVSAATEWA